MLRGSRFSRDSGDLKSPFLAGKERELLESKKWPACFSQSVDITKVQIDAFKPWITRRVTELMGVEDEIVVDYCISQLKFFGETDAKANTENAGDGGVGLNEKPYLDPKKLQINLTGFMAKNARVFVKELWDLLIAAQDNDYGIPQAFIDEKKREIAEIQSAAKEVDSTLKEMAMKPAGESTEAFDNGGSFVGAHGDGHSKKSVEAPSCDVASLRRGSMEHRRAPRSRSRSPSTAWYKDHKYHRSKGGYRGSSHSRRFRHDHRRLSHSVSSSRSRSISPMRHRRARRSGSYARHSYDRRSHSSRSPPTSMSKERNVPKKHRHRSPSRGSSSSYSHSRSSPSSSSYSHSSSSSSSSSYDRRKRRDIRDYRREGSPRSRAHMHRRRSTSSHSRSSSSASFRRPRSYSRSYTPPRSRGAKGPRSRAHRSRS